MPFQPSPHRDDGYDVADYYGVDPRYGTLGDFVEFTQGCRQSGLRVLIDLVVNHTSDQHPWFQQARQDPKSKYRNWYVWSKKKPRDANKGMVFPGVQKSTWNYDPVAKEWYFHRFYDFQPDLNTSNPEVQRRNSEDHGILAAVRCFGIPDGRCAFCDCQVRAPMCGEPAEKYDMLRMFREFLSWREGDAIILAEANVIPHVDMDYFGSEGERMQMMFNFEVNQHLFYALASGDSRPLIASVKGNQAASCDGAVGAILAEPR